MSALNRHIDMGCPPPPPKTSAAAPAAVAPAAAVTTTAPAIKVGKAKKKGRAEKKLDISDAVNSGTNYAPAKKNLPAKPAPPAAEAFPLLSQQQAAKAPNPEPPPPTPKPQPAEERRIDITDGNAYTLADFVAEYGGTREWDMAKPAAEARQPRAPAASPALDPQLVEQLLSTGLSLNEVHSALGIS